MSTLRSLSPNPSCSSSSSSYSPNPNPAAQPSLLAFFGGTAFNGVVKDLKTFTTRFPQVLPVSDDGGSTAEIVRVLGGPVVGDVHVRSRSKHLRGRRCPAIARSSFTT
ncbi:hypothetical protein ABKV19_008830 [Rosa sericea]